MWTIETTILLFTCLAEIAVAAVIYVEVEQNRRVHFLEKATEEGANEDRRDIYEEYLDLGSFSSLEERSQAFIDKMSKYPELKKACERQIALFNDLGIIMEPWYSQREGLVKILPHAAIYIWIILKPYILRRRENTGDWLAEPLLVFTHQCAKFLIKEHRPLHLHGSQEGQSLTISVEYIRDIERDLDARICERSRGRYLR